MNNDMWLVEASISQRQLLTQFPQDPYAAIRIFSRFAAHADLEDCKDFNDCDGVSGESSADAAAFLNGLADVIREQAGGES